MKVEFVKLTETAVLPTYAHEGDAGADLYADSFVAIAPGERKLVRTGIAAIIPRGYEGQVRSRSGNAVKRGLMVLNSPGTIDSGYRGEWNVILFNTSEEWQNINYGDRIAQVVFAKHERPEILEVSPTRLEQDLVDSRGANGCGSTGQ